MKQNPESIKAMQERARLKLIAKGGMKRGVFKKKTGVLAKVSAKQMKRNREYSKIRAAFLLEHPSCFGCGKPASEVHHARGRSGDFYTDKRYLRALCIPCHKTAHSDYQTALKGNVSMSRHRRNDE